MTYDLDYPGMSQELLASRYTTQFCGSHFITMSITFCQRMGHRIQSVFDLE